MATNTDKGCTLFKAARYLSKLQYRLIYPCEKEVTISDVSWMKGGKTSYVHYGYAWVIEN